MALHINHVMLEKLTHNIQEIRVRALHDIESKLKRALIAEEAIKFNSLNLFRSLIRWFGQTPLCEADTVLELISILIESKYGQEVIDHFKCERIEKELNKIRAIIGKDEFYDELIGNIIASVKSFGRKETSMTNLANSMSSLQVTCVDPSESPTNFHPEHDSYQKIANYYTKCWEEPEPSDLKSLQSLNLSLHPDGGIDNVKHALNYLQTAIKDFPAEFFLQPPYIFHTLMAFTKRTNTHSKQLLQIYASLTKSLQKRVRSRQMAKIYVYENINRVDERNKCVQISVSRYCFDLFLMIINHLKVISDEIDQEETNSTFQLMLELVILIKLDPNDTFGVDEILKDLGFLIKYYRQCWETCPTNHSYRTQYLILIYITSLLIKLNEENIEMDLNATEQDTLFPNKIQYQVSEYESINSATNSATNWKHELQVALLDYPLQHIHPDIYGLVMNSIRVNSKKMNYLLSADEVLMPAIEILRQPNKFSDEDLIMKGLKAIESLYLHKSRGLIKLLIKAISNCASYFDGNPTLKEAGELLLLRLLSHSNDEIKCLVYEMCTEKVKFFCSCVDEGSVLTNRKSYANKSGSCQSLGIPLTVEIMTEIICFGFGNKNQLIHENAETLLLIILRCKVLVSESKWGDILELIIPVLPLLEAIVEKNTNLGKSIIGLVHPKFDLPHLELVRGNLRFLFVDDAEVREEALTRILFIVSIHPQAKLYAPNIDHIRDTIPNTLCQLQIRYDASKFMSNDVYEANSVKPLLDLLKETYTDPSLRRTTLVQLNVMAEDPALCEIIHKNDGWAFILQALDNALKEEHMLDYPDTAVPAIGILTKLCFTIPEFRRFLAENSSIYNLLIRALLSFHHLDVFKRDCCTLLFLLLFSDHTMGGNYSVSLPHIISKFRIPIICDYHWKFSPFNVVSYLEEIFVDRDFENDFCEPISNKFDGICGRECGSAQFNRFRIAESTIKTEEEPANNYKTVAWKYLRLSFACLWFDAFENILINSRRSKIVDKIIDYTILPPHFITEVDKDVINLSDGILDFDKCLHLKKGDIDMIKTTLLEEKFRSNLKRISIATSHDEVFVGISGLQSNLILPFKEQIQHDAIIKSIKKFILTPPNNEADSTLYINVIKLLGNLIELGFENILTWIISQMFDQTNIFLQLIKSDTNSNELFEKNVDFIKKVLKESYASDNPNLMALILNTGEYGQIVKREYNFNLLNHIFEMIIKRLEDDLRNCDLVKLRSLLSLLRVITLSNNIEFDENYINHVINRLLSYIMAVKSLTQSGSNITKNALLTISQLMTLVREIHVKTKHFKILSALCGHVNPLIRASSWNVLAKIAKQLNGAHKLIQELSYLPGGIHACCLSTLLDPEEVSLVKESACGLFVNMLSHKINENGLHKSVAPVCMEKGYKSNDDPLSLILEILKRQKVYDRILETLQYFTTDDLVDLDFDSKLTTCETVRGYCLIFIAFIELKEDIIDILLEKCCVQLLMGCVSKVPLLPSKSALIMVSTICNFLSRCLRYKKEAICNIITQNQSVPGGLVYLLNPLHYANFDDQVMIETTSNIMEVLMILCSTTIGTQLISCVLADLEFEPLVLTIHNGITFVDNKDYQITCCRFLSKLLLSSPVTTSSLEFPSFLNSLETTEMKCIPNVEAKVNINNNVMRRTMSFEKIKTMSDEYLNDLENQDPNLLIKRRNLRSSDAKSYNFGSEILCLKLLEQFDVICARDKPKNGALKSTALKRMLFSTIQVILKQSKGARKVATERSFLTKVFDRFDSIFLGLGTNCSDFIRKKGDKKKEVIVDELLLLSGILSCWFSNDVLVDELYVAEICKLLLKSWAWICTNHDLQVEFMKMLAYLSEDSIPVCRAITVSYSGYPHTILKLIAAVLTSETARVKCPKADLSLLKICLRILSNCCSCYEGRVLIGKLNILDIISRLHPSVTKLLKPWVTVTKYWLAFWEIYTRYPEFASLKHMSVLCALVRIKTIPEIRILSLKIVRNMSFVNLNRPGLLSSQDFLYVLKATLDDDNREEQFIVLTSIWKLVANSHKGKFAIKNSPVPRKLNMLLQQISAEEDCDTDDLFNVLSIVMKILNS